MSQPAIQITAGNIRSSIEGYHRLPRAVRDALDVRTRFQLEGAWYMAAASAMQEDDPDLGGQTEEGHWDGNIRLIARGTGTFPTGIIPLIEQELIRFGYYVRIMDTRAEPVHSYEMPHPHLELRDCQVAAVDAYMANPRRRGILELPPRSGKTYVGAEIIRRLRQHRALFICERLDIAQPPRGAVAKFQEYFGPDFPVGWAYDGEFQDGAVVVATVQTLAAALGLRHKRKKGERKEKAMTTTLRKQVADYARSTTVLVIDECHHAAAPSYRAVARQCGEAFWVAGLSGTAWRDEGDDLLMVGVTGPVIHKVTKTEMIDAGLLVPTVVLIVHLPKKRYASDSTYAERRRDYLILNPPRNAAIAEFIQHQTAIGKSVMVLVELLSQAEVMDNLLNIYSIPHIVMAASGKYNVAPSKRPQVWTDLQEKRNLVLVTTLANEGVDVPSLDSVVIAAGGASTVQTLQRVRCATAWPGKEFATVLDFADRAKYFGSHFEERLRMYVAEPGAFTIRHITSFAELKDAAAWERMPEGAQEAFNDPSVPGDS